MSTLRYVASPVVHGSVSAEFTATAASRVYVAWDATGPSDLYGRLYLQLTGLPAVGNLLSLVRVVDAAGLTMAGFNISATGTVNTVQYNGSVGGVGAGANGSTPIVTGSPVRLEWHMVLGSAAGGLVEVRLFTTPEGTTPAETITASAVNTTGTPAQYRTGSCIARTIPPPPFYVDDLVWGLTDWPGPTGTTPPPPPPPPPPDTSLTYPGAPVNWTTQGTDVPGSGTQTATLRALSIDGAGYQNTGEYAPLGPGHQWKAASGGDTAGCHISVDDLNWVTANRGLGAANTRVSAIMGSRTVANRLYMYTSTNDGGGAGGRLWRGTFDPATTTVTWTQIATVADGARAGLGIHPRQTGRTLCLDEAGGFAYIGTVSGVYRTALPGGGTATRIALSGAEVSGIVADPDDPTILYATCSNNSNAGQPGVWRITNARGAANAGARFALTNAQDLVAARLSATSSRLYVAAMGQGIRRWTISADITGGWVDVTNNFNLTGNGAATVDAFVASGAVTKLYAATAGEAGNNNAGGWATADNGASTAWTNENGGWTISENVLGYSTSQQWWLTKWSGFYLLSGNGQDSTACRIDPANSAVLHHFGRSGGWRSPDGITWRPSVKGIEGAIGWGITCAPSGSGAIAQDADWGSIHSNDKFTTQPTRTVPGGNLSTAMGVAFRADNGRAMLCHGDFSGNVGGDAFVSSNPTVANPTWTNLGFAGGNRCVGAAIGQNAAGTEVYLTLRDGIGIQRKVGSGTPTTVETGITNGFYARARFAWPNGHTGTQPFVFCAASNGFWVSDDYGATWVRRLTYTNTSEYSGSLDGLPGTVGTLFVTIDGSVSGLYKITGATTTSPTLTRIGPAVTAPGPCAVDAAGYVYLAVTSAQSGGAKLYKSADPNPGAATSFTSVGGPRWDAEVTFPADMDLWADGELAVSAKNAGYYGWTATGTSTGGYSGCCNSTSTNATGGVIHDYGGTAGCGTAGGDPFTPAGTYSQWGLAGSWRRMEWKLRIDDDDPNEGHFWAMQTKFQGTTEACYFGLQRNGIPPSGPPTKLALFSVWGAVGAVAGDAPGASGEPFTEGTSGWRVLAPYAWTLGSVYTLRVQADEARGLDWWRLEVVADATGTVTWIGSVQVPGSWGDLEAAAVVAFTEWFTNPGTITSCLQIPRATAFFGTPGFSAVTVVGGGGTGGGGGGTGTGVAQPLLLALHRPLAAAAAVTTPPSIDASSPTSVRSGNTNSVRTTASFTPPAGSLLVAIAANNTQAGIVRDRTISDSASGTWTQRAYVNDLGGTDGPGNRGQMSIWTRDTAGAGAAMTVTDTIDANEGGWLKVLVLTSANVATPTGDVASASGLATAAGVSVTTLYDHSLVIGAVTEWNLTAVGTAGPGCTVSDGAVGPNITSYVLRRAAETSPAGTAALTTTAPTAGTEWNAVAVEFRGSGLASSYPTTYSTTY